MATEGMFSLARRAVRAHEPMIMWLPYVLLHLF
jgi:hypothetical protein